MYIKTRLKILTKRFIGRAPMRKGLLLWKNKGSKYAKLLYSNKRKDNDIESASSSSNDTLTVL